MKKNSHVKALCVLIVVMPLSVFSVSSEAKTNRELIREFSASEFKKSKNDCKSFAKVAEYAASVSASVPDWFEDMRLVIIGSDWSRKSRGEFFHGVKTGDSGFKKSLRDGSSQVEHAMAAIYFGKGLPPALTTVFGSVKEAIDAYERNQTISVQDITLWAIGEDIGARISKSNLKSIGTPIRRTMCE